MALGQRPPKPVQIPSRYADDDCLKEPRWLYYRPEPARGERDLAACLPAGGRPTRSSATPVQESIAKTRTFYLPREYPKHLESTNMLERVNEEIERRNRVVHIFPNQ